MLEGVHIQGREIQKQALGPHPLRLITLPELEGVAAALAGLLIGHMEPDAAVGPLQQKQNVVSSVVQIRSWMRFKVRRKE